MGDLQILFINPTCLEFGQNDCVVRLKQRRGYVPKVLTTPFKVQDIILQEFALDAMEATTALLLCPVYTLCVYIECSSQFHLP